MSSRGHPVLRPLRSRSVLLVPALAVLTACAGTAVDPVELARLEVAQVPGAAAGAYEAPTEAELSALGGLVRDLSTGAGTEGEAGDVGYVVDRVRQAGLDGERSELSLLRPSTARPSGWGWVAVRPHGATPVVVEVPHPRADVHTELLGAALFAETAAHALVVAGAHRRSADDADVVRERGSAFHAWQTAVVSHGDVVVQVHGFDAAAHPDIGADTVVSDGEENRDGSRPSAVSRRVADELERAGFTVCLHHRDRCDALAGTRNVQGMASRAAGADFVHLELSRSLRSSPLQRTRVVAALATAVQPRDLRPVLDVRDCCTSR